MSTENLKNQEQQFATNAVREEVLKQSEVVRQNPNPSANTQFQERDNVRDAGNVAVKAALQAQKDAVNAEIRARGEEADNRLANPPAKPRLVSQVTKTSDEGVENPAGIPVPVQKT